MPKKPNNATPYGSKPQDYVPKGNGDESGEYRPYGAGGGSRTTDPNNQGGGKFPKGFKDFKTPKKEEPPKEEPKKEQPKINPVERDKSNIERINSELPQRSPCRKTFQHLYESGSEEAKNVMTKILDKGLKYDNKPDKDSDSYFSPSKNKIQFKKDTARAYLEGRDNEIFWHETGHALDYALGNALGVSDTASYHYKFDDNKTLSETLDEEFDNGKIREKILNDFAEDIKPYDDKIADVKKEIMKKVDEWDMTENGKEFALLSNSPMWTLKEQSRFDELIKERDDYARELINKRNDLTIERDQIRYKWSDMGDQLRVGAYNSPIGWGHKRGYYNIKDNTPNEFFAEYSSAKWCGNKQKLAKFNKYFPKTSAKMEKLLEKANKEF